MVPEACGTPETWNNGCGERCGDPLGLGLHGIVRHGDAGSGWAATA